MEEAQIGVAKLFASFNQDKDGEITSSLNTETTLHDIARFTAIHEMNLSPPPWGEG